MRSALRKLYWFVSTQLGVDPRRIIRAVTGAPRFLATWMRFKNGYAGRLALLPCLQDWHEEGGAARGEYFWQDLYVARKIHMANPSMHVDIGSRVDGFVAHIASFRDIEVFDIRPIPVQVPGIRFKQQDLMNPHESLADYCDSLSCLHALEHFGLGRYGDPVDPRGHETGLRNMARIVRSGGVFYLSVPVGIERVEFNAHRVFAPQTIVGLASGNQLLLEAFAWVGPDGALVESMHPEDDFAALSRNSYGLGIFTFRKQ